MMCVSHHLVKDHLLEKDSFECNDLFPLYHKKTFHFILPSFSITLLFQVSFGLGLLLPEGLHLSTNFAIQTYYSKIT